MSDHSEDMEHGSALYEDWMEEKNEFIIYAVCKKIYDFKGNIYESYSYFSDRKKAIAYQKFLRKEWNDKTSKLIKIIVDKDVIKIGDES